MTKPPDKPPSAIDQMRAYDSAQAQERVADVAREMAESMPLRIPRWWRSALLRFDGVDVGAEMWRKRYGGGLTLCEVALIYDVSISEALACLARERARRIEAGLLVHPLDAAA